MREHERSLHETGMAVIHAVGDEGFSSLSSALDRLDPDFKRLLVEGAYAGLIARPNLALKHRELITVAVLATGGNADSALKYHAAGMLNTGWTPEELIETILHTLVYSGVSVAISAMRIVCTVFHERGIETEWKEMGAVHETEFLKSSVDRLINSHHEIFAPFPLDLQKIFTEMVCRIVSSRPMLTLKDRELATLAIVMARGNQLAAVRAHLKACMRLGWRRSELTEVMIQLTGYIGWPLVLPVTRAALEAFEEIETDKVSDVVRSQAPVDAPAATSLPPSVGLSGFAVPKGVASLSPAVADYLEAMGLKGNGPQSSEQARAQRLTDIACLTCLARNAEAAVLAEHVKEALSLGASMQDITDAILRTLPHAGALAVREGIAVANQVFGDTTQVDIADRRIA